MHHTISIHLFNQHIEPQRVPQSSTGESRRKRVPTPMHRFMNPQVGHQNIHQVARGIPLSPQISTARHTSSVLKSLKTQSDKITPKGKLDPLQERRGGKKHHRIQI